MKTSQRERKSMMQKEKKERKKDWERKRINYIERLKEKCIIKMEPIISPNGINENN